MRCLSCILVALIVSPTTAMAADWQLISTTNGSTRFVDRASVQRKGHFASLVTENREDTTVRSTEHFDCASRKMKVSIQLPPVIYTDGGMGPSTPPVSEWVAVSEIVDGNAMYRIACSLAAPKRAKAVVR